MIRSTESPSDELDYLPARMINEFSYCPRLFYLEHVEGLFAHNADTIEGASRHARVDAKTDELPAADSIPQQESIHARSVTLSSDTHGIIAKLDLVEVDGTTATPVDYKRGSPRKLPDGSLTAWDPERIQLCVQALVLRDHGFLCDEGILFFWETRQRVRIPFDDALIALTLETIRSARELMVDRKMPPPLIDSPKCPRCSLVSICLPDETTRCARVSDEPTGLWKQELLFDLGPQFDFTPVDSEDTNEKPIRQLVSSRDERKPVYLNTQGLSIGVSGQVLTVKEKEKKIQEIRLKDVSQVNLFGAIQVSTQAIQVLLAEEIPLIYFSFGGWFHGMTQPVGLKNILWRREQFRMADRPQFCLGLARELVAGKIRNQRTMLQRNHIEPPADTLRFLRSMIWEAERTTDLQALLGVEGIAARAYFEQFAGMLKVSKTKLPISKGASSDCDSDPKSNDEQDVATPEEDIALATGAATASGFTFDFTRRNRRPPRDPVNALLSLGYGLLSKDLTILCASVGLDPFLGFYHQPRFGRPSLALDMMEPFRPLIVDSAVLSAINQRMITLDDFISAGDAVALTPKGRKNFYLAYEQRMDQLVTHPMFGYRVSYRRLMEIQVRLLARLLMGEIRRYPVFVTR
ncbi:MAG: CRISPR-associated endonuclease Cas1 [Planctomycetota bacterium]